MAKTEILMPGTAPVPISQHATGLVTADSREKASVFVAAELAMMRPRNEALSLEDLKRTCGNPTFAEIAQYRFPRGGKELTGPSVNLAREAARCWGNIRYGIDILSSDQERMRIAGWAWDVQRNIYTTSSDEFKRLIQRRVKDAEGKSTDQTVWVEPDERDMRELINRRGAICVRNAILQLLPPHVIEVAITECDKTLALDGEEALKRNRDLVVSKLQTAFAEFDVNTEMLERRLGHPLKQLTWTERNDLLKVYAAIKDGSVSVKDAFPDKKPEPKETTK